jgi:hypothetical protein
MPKWVSLTKGWSKPHLHTFFNGVAFVLQHDALHTCQLHIFIKFGCHFGMVQESFCCLYQGASCCMDV